MTDIWRNRPVLVTGCTGLLGSWLTRHLVQKGADVIGLVRDAVPRSMLFAGGIADKITLVRGDIRNQQFIERVLHEYNVSVIFHLAAQAIVGIANRSPTETFDVNIRGTWSILEAARQFGKAQAVVVASSDKAYGASAQLPYTESTPLQGQHPYDVSKSCADLIAHTYAHTYDLPVGITRCGNLFGGGDLNWNRIVPGTMRAIIENESPLIRSDGTMVRDYLYIEDAVHAYLTLAAALINQPDLRGAAFNFGNNRPLAVLELVQEILQISDRQDLQPTVLGQANNEIQEQFLDSSAAQQKLDWQPQFGLKDGLKSTFSWYQKYFSME